MRFPYLVSLSPLHPDIPRTCMITSIYFHCLRIFYKPQIVSIQPCPTLDQEIISITQLNQSGQIHYFESILHGSVKIPGGKTELGPKDIPQQSLITTSVWIFPASWGRLVQSGRDQFQTNLFITKVSWCLNDFFPLCILVQMFQLCF